MSVVYPGDLVFKSEDIQYNINNIDVCNGGLGEVTFTFHEVGSAYKTGLYFNIYTDAQQISGAYIKAEITNAVNWNANIFDAFYLKVQGELVSLLDKNDIIGVSTSVSYPATVDTSTTKDICGQTLYLVKYGSNSSTVFVGFYAYTYDNRFNDYINYILEHPVEIDLRITIKLI